MGTATQDGGQQQAPQYGAPPGGSSKASQPGQPGQSQQPLQPQGRPAAQPRFMQQYGQPGQMQATQGPQSMRGQTQGPQSMRGQTQGPQPMQQGQVWRPPQPGPQPQRPPMQGQQQAMVSKFQSMAPQQQQQLAQRFQSMPQGQQQQLMQQFRQAGGGGRAPLQAQPGSAWDRGSTADTRQFKQQYREDQGLAKGTGLSKDQRADMREQYGSSARPAQPQGRSAWGGASRADTNKYRQNFRKEQGVEPGGKLSKSQRKEMRNSYGASRTPPNMPQAGSPARMPIQQQNLMQNRMQMQQQMQQRPPMQQQMQPQRPMQNWNQGQAMNPWGR